ncbi:MAG: glycosyltransferase family 4 protein [Burkholderiales bacterium]|nr:glycosyltransferase family 4 protein [Burkholderiales bacterium]
MKIALIRQRYNPFGGAERFVARAAAALAAEGAGVTVFARDWQGGGEVRAVRCDPFYVGRVWRDWSFARAACAATARERFDLVQSHERLACCDIYRAGDGVHRQWLENRSRALGPLARLAQALGPYHRYVLAAERRLFASPRLRAVICNSRMVRDDIRRHFGLAEEKLRVIYNGVDTEAFHPRVRDEFRTPMRARLGIAPDAPVLLFVGSGFERKGVARLVTALARMATPEARLVVVGKDKAEARCAAMARRLGVAGRVHFAGGQQDVRPWYGLADAFALPTLYDPFPNAALEALACGLPVVTSPESGAAELVETGANGHVCDALDIPAIARACDAALALGRDPAARAAARRAAEPLDIASMAKELLALYRSLASG